MQKFRHLAAAFVLGLGSASMSFTGPAHAQSEGGWQATVDEGKSKTAKPSGSEDTKVSQATGAGSSAKPDKPAAGGATPAAPPTTPPAAPDAAAEPSGPAKSETIGDWVRECRSTAGKDSCTLRQTVRDGKKRRIVSFIAAHSKATPFLELHLPLGLSIPYGVTLELGADVKLPTQLVDCNAAGCRSVVPLDDTKLGLMKAAKSLAVSFQDSKTGKIITISGSVKGLSDGLGRGFGAT